MTLQEREARACAIIDSMAQELRAVSLYLHDNPELGLNEHKAVKAIHQFLEKQNFISQVGLTDIRELQTALRADYRGNAKYKIAFLGEYDALPELGHGCGHNLIAMMSLGAAVASVKVRHRIGERLSLVALQRKLSVVRYIWQRLVYLRAMRRRLLFILAVKMRWGAHP